MSQIFHKNCYTSRSSGYKYRTLATNTGDKKRRDTVEDSVFDKKFKELKKTIYSRIEKEIDKNQSTRDIINSKFEKVNAKIDSMLDVQTVILALRKDLNRIENTLCDLNERVDRIDVALGSTTNSSASPSAVSALIRGRFNTNDVIKTFRFTHSGS